MSAVRYLEEVEEVGEQIQALKNPQLEGEIKEFSSYYRHTLP